MLKMTMNGADFVVSRFAIQVVPWVQTFESNVSSLKATFRPTSGGVWLLSRFHLLTIAFDSQRNSCWEYTIVLCANPHIPYVLGAFISPLQKFYRKSFFQSSKYISGVTLKTPLAPKGTMRQWIAVDLLYTQYNLTLETFAKKIIVGNYVHFKVGMGQTISSLRV